MEELKEKVEAMYANDDTFSEELGTALKRKECFGCETEMETQSFSKESPAKTPTMRLTG